MTKWHIVPVNDGYNVLSKNDEEHYLTRKPFTNEDPNVLSFDSIEEAEEYILTNLDKTKYIPEIYWTVKFKED